MGKQKNLSAELSNIMAKLKFICLYCPAEFKQIKLLFDHYQEKHKNKGFKMYDIKHNPTGQKGMASALSAQEACLRLGWLLDDCLVKEYKERK